MKMNEVYSTCKGTMAHVIDNITNNTTTQCYRFNKSDSAVVKFVLFIVNSEIYAGLDEGKSYC